MGRKVTGSVYVTSSEQGSVLLVAGDEVPDWAESQVGSHLRNESEGNESEGNESEGNESEGNESEGNEQATPPAKPTRRSKK